MDSPARLLRRVLIAAVVTLCCVGTALADDAAQRAYDPWEGYNRAMFKFNMGVDRHVLRPVAHAYRDVVPSPVRTGLANFFSNLMEPLHMVNDLLQLKPGRAAGDLGRFVINTTVGIGGLFDPASDTPLHHSDEDFGQTLGKWGVGSGPYLVVPFLPPTTLRDFGSAYPDYKLDPVGYMDDDRARYGTMALRIVDQRSRVLDLDETIDNAYDPYAFVRDALLQRRAYQIRDGAPLPDAAKDEYDDPGEPPAPAPATTPPADANAPPPR